MQKEFEGKNKQIGVLITNLGTPDSPTKKDLKKYLNQFLMALVGTTSKINHIERQTKEISKTLQINLD